MVHLVAESGYLDYRGSISSTAIEHFLSAHPEHMEDWELESLDSRSSDAWFFQPVSAARDGAWRVGRGSELHTFPDHIRACSFYVCRFVEGIYRRHFDESYSNNRNA